MKIKKNDLVKITAGKDKGKTGKVIQVFPVQNKIVVEGINLRYRHVRPKRQNEKGQRLEYAAPFDASNVMIIDPKTGRPTRVKFKYLENKEKIRVSSKTGEVI